MKKVIELNVQFNPWLMGIMLSLVTATSTGFSFTFYMIGITCCVLFNSFKVHRACIDHFLSRWAIESLFPISCILLLVNLLVNTPSTMLYTLSQGWLIIFWSNTTLYWLWIYWILYVWLMINEMKTDHLFFDVYFLMISAHRFWFLILIILNTSFNFFSIICLFIFILVNLKVT